MRLICPHNPLTHLRRLHRDEQGTISIVSVFAVMLLTMLLGMVMNVGRAVDGKIRMQNSADAAAYSGGVVLARGMNTLTFSNHLLADVFALTAFMREARDRNAETYSQPILDAWQRVGPVFTASGFPKFERLGPALVQEAGLERELVRAYSDWAAASSEQVLPLLEIILQERMIPEYQRAVTAAFPDIAQTAAMEIADRCGRPDRGRGRMLAVLWRASALPVGGYGEPTNRTLPVVDPVMDLLFDQEKLLEKARKQRKSMANRYLSHWNNQTMLFFDRKAKMCQFSAFWRSFTCGQLKQLLEDEYPDTNLPHLIRTEKTDVVDASRHMAENFTFLAVVYWKKLPERMPGLFKNRTESAALAFAQVRMFVPRRRLRWYWYGPGGGGGSSDIPIGGVPGDFPDLPSDEVNEPGTGGDPDGGRWRVGRQGVSEAWDLLNQRWTCQLVPAVMPNLALILQTAPPLPEFDAQELTVPNLGGLDSEDIERINTH
ncbi:MAG: Tad domain-containing protein [Thermoguttaceae bacterium]